MKGLSILSGGADSTICTAIALKECSEVYTITFDYGQRHKIEIESAAQIAKILGVSSHEVIECKGILHSVSPLTSKNNVEQYQSADDLPNGIANTFVPARNLFFLTIAANRAIELGCEITYTGVCQTDFSGYPDCRRSFIDSTEKTLILGLEIDLTIKTPLMNLTKSESVLLGMNVLGSRFNEVIGLTHTCYNGVRGGCGKCAACLLRDRGFQDAGVVDPIWRFR